MQRSVEWFHLVSSPNSHPLFFFLPLFHQCDGYLEWVLMAGLRDLPAMGAIFYIYLGDDKTAVFSHIDKTASLNFLFSTF